MQKLIEVEVTPEMLERARDKANKLGRLKNSITKGKGNLTGFIGEEIAHVAMGGEIQNTKNFDIVLEDGRKFDVKSKKCRDEPEPHFDCSVANYNTSQKCDEYIFVRVLNDYSKGWVCGSIAKDDFFRKATFWQQGQWDPRNNWRCKADCYSLPISQLDEVHKVI
jgi:hypothetical protein